MSRRRAAVERKILVDPRHGSELVAKFINQVMKSGKKSVAEKIVYDAIEAANDKSSSDDSENSLVLLKKAVDNVAPYVEVKSRRVGGSTYQVPVEVRPKRRLALAMRWLIEAAKKRKNEKGMAKRLASEIKDAASSRGAAVKKKEDVHRMADANKAFAHYRW